MAGIKLIVLGRADEKIKSLCNEYIKRIGGFCKIEFAELKEVPVYDGLVEKSLLKEADDILSRIKKDDYVTALCVEGKRQSSEEFASFLGRIRDSGKTAVFIIGSSFGLAESVKSRADARVSMSDMTFPHGLARVMLLEQIYRGFAILGNKAYHK